MNKFTANYCRSNSNFVITNLPKSQVTTPYTNIIRIVQNMIMRGAPTIASTYLRKELGINDRNYINQLKEIKFISGENLFWTRTIKGDVSNNDYPANQFYDDLEHIFNRLNFLRNLMIAECPISDILPDITHAFNKQMVDFYLPFLKTVIEVDGEGHKRQMLLDKQRDHAFERAGITVVRIHTKDIRNKSYEKFKSTFIEIYKVYKERIEQYWHYLYTNPKDYELQIQLTSIARFQVFILELLDRGVLTFNSKSWSFNVFTTDAKQHLELALKDLELWIGHVSALFNTRINMPHIKITFYENQSELSRDSEGVNIKIDLFKRWDDTVYEPNVYHIRTDFDDDANYFAVKTNEPVVYSLTPKTHKKHLEFILENLFGFEEFREGQLEIIINCLNGKDTVGLLPTGGGKSLTYQLCVMLQPAISFVVVPIKSLMLDQIDNLTKKHHITHASFINGDLTPEESSKRLKDFAAGKSFFLIISPERFQAKGFRDELLLVNYTKALSIAVIDEVHCLSEWGHDFRTSYLALANSIRKFAPSARFLALTATASSKVLKDIMTELEIEGENVITISNFTRKELKFNIIPVNRKNKQESLVNFLQSTNLSNGATLVFTATVNGKNGCYELSHHIHSRTGVSTGFYSGSAPKNWDTTTFSKYKDQVQQSFMKDEINVMVATKAFGMGIDKPNIRQTIHYGIPGSLESFYQEAGRAGRDKGDSNCLVFYSPDALNEAQSQTIFGMNTDLPLLKEEMKKLPGDLSTLLFFLTSNLIDIEAEVEEIYTFYQSKLSIGNNEVIVDFYNDREREREEKCVYRLALLGIVEDWTLNWKSRQIEVELGEWTEQTVIEKLTKHINKYDSMFTLKPEGKPPIQYAGLIERFNGSKEPFLKRILFVLLKWYNDNVIYSRKRSMLLMKQYADEFTDSESLQKKIEVYFKRNDDVYLLEEIVAKKDRLKDWFKIFYVQEEGKEDQPRGLSTFKSLKITISRFLESYNNDISLNLINGLVSLAQDELDSYDDRERMVSAIREISKMDPEVRQEMLNSILDKSDAFLSSEQRTQLSVLLISNGFDLMEDLKEIHSSLEDRYSYGSMLKTLHSTIKEQSYGGYPWEV
ncbi:ATP-dependent DNA helicase RecQ [Bacillus sp. SLBN-46]|uniref:RecQ family ATP-dependent DNA helicase n=1 Tax=Bacillus sp. SLBN-46 TaxID=3042283 RepID=UPI002859105A|nr:RecQ family ATP-dependent DNA helicase [Bacillus sp. SLBN-46]MDR6121343.1 ATP-dependent DNA helicase RecQ [Bacillus sp. SLBN-46]